MRPIAPPNATAAGRMRNGDVAPACPISTTTSTALTKPIAGPIDTSMPPRPPRIGGVAASAAQISGEASPISAPKLPGAKRAGFSQRLTISSPASSAKPGMSAASDLDMFMPSRRTSPR